MDPSAAGFKKPAVRRFHVPSILSRKLTEKHRRVLLVLLLFLSAPFTFVGLSVVFQHVVPYMHTSKSYRPLPPLPLYQRNAWARLAKPPATSPSAYQMCLLYDKPERTGSSTIMMRLQKCWRAHNYVLPWHPVRPSRFESIVKTVLSVNASHVGFARDHFHINESDIDIIRDRCKDLFYITSIRPMRNRIMSKGKYDIKYTHIHINSTLEPSDKEKAYAFALNLIKANVEEPKWERYPFLGRLRIPPDYIIRHESYHEDFGRLLEAFGCNPVFKSTNVHFLSNTSANSLRDEDEDDDAKDFVAALAITHNDTAFTYLNEYARRYNEEGLGKLRAMKFKKVNDSA